MKILIIRFKKIGDVVLTSVLCSSVKNSLPQCRVDFLTYEGASAQVLENHPSVDNVYQISSAERRNPLKYLSKVRGICKNKYDVILDASSTGKSELISLMSFDTQYRIGRKKVARGLFYSHLIESELNTGNKVSERLRLLQPMEEAGLPIWPDRRLTVVVTPDERLAMREQLLLHGVDLHRPILTFSVSSGVTHKKWKKEYQAEVAQHCINRYQAQILLYFGSASEEADINEFYQCMGAHSDVFHKVPTPSIRKLAALISHSDLFIGNDGGPRHIAEGLEVPSVAIFSPCAPRRHWLPGNNKRYQGIDWSDVCKLSHPEQLKFKIGDNLYYKLLNSVKPIHVIKLVDEVVKNHTNIPSIHTG